MVVYVTVMVGNGMVAVVGPPRESVFYSGGVEMVMLFDSGEYKLVGTIFLVDGRPFCTWLHSLDCLE